MIVSPPLRIDQSHPKFKDARTPRGSVPASAGFSANPRECCGVRWARRRRARATCPENLADNLAAAPSLHRHPFGRASRASSPGRNEKPRHAGGVTRPCQSITAPADARNSWSCRGLCPRSRSRGRGIARPRRVRAGGTQPLRRARS
jgi:hypothetical protein